MKQENGITLISLVVTIIVLVILSSVGISQGLAVMENAKINKFSTQLQIVQYRVNYYYAKGEYTYEENNEPKTKELGELGKEINSSKMVALLTEKGKNINDYRYFSEEDLKLIGAENVDIPIVINFSTRDVIGVNGVKKDGVMCYTLEDLGESYNIEYEGPTNNAEPTFSLEKTINGLNAIINISNITYNGAIKKGTIYYGEVIDDTANPITVNYWQELSSDTININKSGSYAIKVVDNLGNQTIETVEIKLANAPKLVEGMTLVENEYDYSTNKWAIASKDEIQYVWVPRYSYKNSNIKFLKGILNIPTDNNVETGYIVNSSFTVDEKEITGIWVKNISNIIERIKNSPDIDISTEEGIIVVK